MSLAAGYTPDEPIAAIATAVAPSALAVIRTSGKNCVELIEKLFSRPKALHNAAGYTMVHGWITEPETSDPVDEVMALVYRAPKSYTGEEMVEICCHGGTAPVSAVFRLLLRNGFREAQRGEFSFRAFINGKTDLTRSEAIREIIDSHTDESRSRAANRLSGNLFDEIERIKQLLVRTTASIEAEIEYPEDEETIADAFDATELKEAHDALLSLSSTWASEKLYQDGARIVLSGRTNAGKSSLFNTLLKEERAIVSSTEGTTRDYLECWVSFAGIPVRLFDTAGLRTTSDAIEQTGVERAYDLAKEADLVLYLVDSVKGIAEEDLSTIKDFSAQKTPVVLVYNKCDSSAAETGAQSALDADILQGVQGTVRVSAKTGSGIQELMQCVKTVLSGQLPTSRASVALGSQRQKTAVDEALESVEHALSVEELGLGLDAAVQDIEDAIASLGEITGEVSPDDILGNIFSRFCVGK